jgi:lipopolysaccharide/colanic/teichoic acid biosynthesis glycosyltransferase
MKMKKRVECDLQRINSWSFWFDLKILVETMPALLHEEAY